MMVRIRIATKKDTSEILDLLYELERPKPKTKSEKIIFKKQILRHLSNKQLIVAEYDFKIVGMACMILTARLNRIKPELYIPDLIISADYRRKGIGKSLIDYCVMVAKKKNCFRIRLESGNKRVLSHKFYDSLGFDQYAKTYQLVI